MLKRCAPEQLMALYALPKFKRGDGDTFLSLVARRLNKFKRGGVPDKAGTAIAVLRDWNSGRVPYYAMPPSDNAHIVGGGVSIVSSFGTTFDPSQMMEADAEVLETSTQLQPLSCVAFESGPAGSGSHFMGTSEDEEEENDDEEDDIDDEEEVEEEEVEEVVTKVATKKAKRSAGNSAASELATSSADSRRQQKANLKKSKKSAKRKADNDVEENDNEDYNFETHF